MVTLFKLDFASFVYSQLTGYEEAYLEFRKKTGKSLDLADADHRRCLLAWLNQWGCRIENDRLPRVSSAIGKWFMEYSGKLVSEKKNIWRLSDSEIEVLADAFEDLHELMIFRYTRDGKATERRLGPTAASKVLFALRPRAAIPWDDKMRKGMKGTARVFTYRQFLERVRDDCIDLKRQCERLGLRMADLPQALNRPHATPAQLLGEYYWVIYTREVRFPDPETMRRWLEKQGL